jgi:cholesterol oxidase
MQSDVKAPAARATAWLSHGLEALIYQRPQINSTARRPPDFDIVIVGSGYGGAVAAAELSSCRDKQNKSPSICVLERGKEYLAGMFPSRMADLPGHVRFTTPLAKRQRGVFDGLFDLRWSQDATVVVASGLGGGSLINAGVMEMPKKEIFNEARWPREISDDKDRLYDLAKQLRAWLGAQPAVSTHKSAVLGQLSLAKPVHVTVSQKEHINAAGVAMSACHGCGDCATGCNYNAKESLDLNLLYLAKQRGVEIYTGATVLKIQQDGTPEPHWQIHVNHTDAHLRDRQLTPFVVRARRVILAAGTLGSTEILSRSNELALSDRLRHGFSANGDILVVAHDLKQSANAVADERKNPVRGEPKGAEGRGIGPTITSMIDLRKGDPNTDLVIQDLAVPGALRRLYEEATTTFDVIDRSADGDWTRHKPNPGRVDDAAVDPGVIKSSLVMAMIGRDDAEGVMRMSPIARDNADGLLTVDWRDLKLDRRLDTHHKHLTDLVGNSGLGGRVVNNLLWRPLSDRLEQIFGRQRGPLLTVHPLGGCSMGHDVLQGVTDHCGRVFNASMRNKTDPFYDGLVVLDGSIVPTSLGINPALTIATLALRAICKLKSDWELEGGLLSEAPLRQWPHTVQRPVYATPRIISKPLPTCIELTEQVRGKVPLRMRDERVEPHVVELTITTKPVELAKLFSHQVKDGRCLPIARGRLRILREGRDFDTISDQVRQDDVALDAEVSGTLRLFDFEASHPLVRIVRAGSAWLVNRGVRDIVQSKLLKFRQRLRHVPLPDEKPPSFGIPDAFRLFTRAGAVRLIEYDFQIDKVGPTFGADFDPAMFAQKKFRAIKRLSYGFGASPWSQLLRMSLTDFPRMSGRRDAAGEWPILELNKRYLARQAIPLLRIVNQQDRVAALADLVSFVLYAMRVILQVHSLSFRRPDPPSTRVPQRLPGPVPGLPSPQIDWLSFGVQNGLNSRIRLARYDPSAKDSSDAPNRPVLLIHGYSASGTTFAHPKVPGNLVERLCARGRDVWVVDMRSSSGMPTATGDWPFEKMAKDDIPTAIDHIRKVTGHHQVDVVGHCMGAAMLSMALLDKPDKLHGKIGRVVFSQVGPAMMLSSTNVLAAFIMRYVRYFLPIDSYEFSPKGEIALAGQVLDRALAAMWIPPEEYKRENPFWPLGKATPWVGTRHRMDALYARTFSLKNLSDEVLDHFDDFFGPLSIETVSQVIHFARFSTVTNRRGINRYVKPSLVAERLNFPMMSLHGEENGLVDVATLKLMLNLLRDADVPYLNGSAAAVERPQSQEEMLRLICANRKKLEEGGASYLTWRIKDHGHQDCLIGRLCGQICDVIAEFLDQKQVA